MVQKLSILIVDDDHNILKLLGDLLGGHPDFDVVMADNGSQAVEAFAERRIDIVLTDIHMPGFNGFEMMADMQKIGQKPEVLVMTANATPENVELARQVGARALILKPFDNLDLIEAELEKAASAATAARAAGNPTPQPKGREEAAPAVPEVTWESTPTPAAKPAPEPIPEPTPGTAKAPALKPTPQAAEPPAKTVSKATVEPATKSTPVPAAKPAPEPIPEPTPGTAAAPALKPTPQAAEPPAKTDSKPSVEPIPTSATLPVAEPAPQPTQAPVVEKPAETSPAAGPPIDAGATTRMPLPEVDAWKADLVGNETPQSEPVPGPAPTVPASTPPAPSKVARTRVGFPDLKSLKDKLFHQGEVPDSGGSRARSIEDGELEVRPKSAATPSGDPVQPPAAAAQPAPSADPVKPAAAAPQSAAVVPSQPAPQEPADAAGPGPAQESSASGEPPVPAELESLFRASADLDTGKLQVQVPIVCLQTWAEELAVDSLRRLAATVKREFHTWSATRGIVKEEDKAMGEMYCDPMRALEFIRRQKQNGLYALLDFSSCFGEHRVVRTLREMVAAGEGARAMLVLIAPTIAVPSELQHFCKSFDWPNAPLPDLEGMLETVRCEMAAQSGTEIDLDPETRRLLIERVREMPAGRARFEFACALTARQQKSDRG